MNQAEECTRCGKCCMNMRQYMIVGPRSVNGRISCSCTLSREAFVAVVPGESLQKIYNRSFSFVNPKACPFLTGESEGTFSCIIYDSRPQHCRNFQCKKTNKEDGKNPV